MKRWLSRRSLGIGMIGLALLIGACSGGNDNNAGELTVDQYFDRLEALADAATDRLNSQSEPAGFADVAGIFNQTLDIFREFLNDIQNTTPPNEARIAHDAFIIAFDEFIDGNRILATQLEGASTAAEFSAILQDLPAEADQAHFNSACGDLQQVATDNNVDVDLGCDLGAQ